MRSLSGHAILVGYIRHCFNRNRQLLKPRFMVKVGHNRKLMSTTSSLDDTPNDGDGNSEPEEQLYKSMTAIVYQPGAGGVHNVFVVHPHIKWGREKRHNTTPGLMVAEAEALVRSLPGWNVAGLRILSVLRTGNSHIFGRGQLESLRNEIDATPNVTAIFVNIDQMSGDQHAKLATLFGRPVFDRYNLVLQIFRVFAKSRESKLQIALAEIPYLRARLRSLNDSSNLDNQDLGALDASGGRGETFWQRRRFLLKQRETKLVKQLQELRANQHLLTEARVRKLQYPLIAVVGYTNAGKTSLIQCLSGDPDLNPDPRLFATLAMTIHPASLPSKTKVLFADTVGFVSHLPMALMPSFSSTLQDIAFADILIEVRDVSHPDYISQTETVSTTLTDLPGVKDKLTNRIVRVGNKIDLVDVVQSETLSCADPDMIPISCATGYGIVRLYEKLEEIISEQLGYKQIELTVPMVGPQLGFLYREAAVQEVIPGLREEELVVKVRISPSLLSKYHGMFPIHKRQ